VSGIPRTVAGIDWPAWRPTERATLLFVIRDGEVLLIRKKTGLGAGKINGPGGRIDPGESDEAGAVREVEEELLVTPTGVRKAGELFFQFTDGYALHGAVYTATGFTGTPTETREAAPLWCPVDAIPYDDMWADDRLWFPLMLAGKGFTGWFVFEGDDMLDARLAPASFD
jgi:8-oxo-dGTP diphosphatase